MSRHLRLVVTSDVTQVIAELDKIESISNMIMEHPLRWKQLKEIALAREKLDKVFLELMLAEARGEQP